MDALPQPDSWHDAQGNLGLDSTPGPINPTFYPYLVSPTQYPQPDTYPLPRNNCHYCPPVALSNWTFPQVSSAVINQVPAFLVVASEVFPTFSSFSFQTFNYNASLAAGIANGTATFNVPLTPSSGVQIANPTGPITGDAFAASSTGTTMVAAYSVGGSTYVYDSLSPSYGSTWTNLTAATPIPGSNPRLSFGGSSALLITKTQCTVYATTIYPYGSPSYTTYSTLAYPQQAAPFWVADSAQGEEGFVVATDSSFVISQAGAGWSCSSGGPSTGQLIEYTSVDGGHTYSSKTIGVY